MQAEEEVQAEPEKSPDGDEQSATNDVADVAPITVEDSIHAAYEQFATLINDYEEEWVLQRYMSSFARAFDPHSDYMSPRAVSDFDIEMKLSLVGIGALLRAEDGAAHIVRLIPGGPAERDGRLQPGDKIIGVGQGDEDPVNTLHWPLSKTVQIIRGEKGTMVTLVIVPDSDPSGTTTTKIELKRDVVKLDESAAKSETHTLELEAEKTVEIGVVKLPAFYVDLRAKSDKKTVDYKSSAKDIRRILGELVDQDVGGVILDLRNNGGGSLLEAVELSGLFIRSGPVVQVKEQRRISVLPDPDRNIIFDGPLIVLVNRLSASASEILAAALQDYGRAVIVGDSQTHGKGTVQTVLPLDRRDQKMGSVKVTTAGFFRVKGGSTQLKGVTPDIIVPSAYDMMDVGEGALKNPLLWSKVNPVPFRQHNDLSRLTPDMRDRSIARRKQNETYMRRQALLEELQTFRDGEEMSLVYGDAMKLARLEKKLGDLHRERVVAADGGKKKSSDLVLEESLLIMRDLIALLNGDKLRATARPAE